MTMLQIQKLKINNFGYYNQFTRNMLFLNQPDGRFLETALQSGVSATDWSWSALFGDYDQDGEQDLFISNGIPKRPNDLDYINFLSNENIKKKINNTNLIDHKALELMPSGHVGNRIFQGSKKMPFIDQSKNWIPQDTIVSGATAYGDLDNDGDLDIITNNLNTGITLYQNLTDSKATYLKLKFDYTKDNKYGIGTKVYSYANGVQQFKELYTVRGFQASSEPIIHFGYGKINKVDSLRIVWPNKSYQIIKDVKTNQTLVLQPDGERPFNYKTLAPLTNPLFEKIEGNLGIDFTHNEDRYTDFNRQKLIPYQLSDRGPAVSIADINKDGKDDIFFGGSKFIPSVTYIQKDSTFLRESYPNLAKDSIKEDISAILEDFNADGNIDLIIGTGGADFYGSAPPLTNSYYSFTDVAVEKNNFPESYENTAVIVPIDVDGDNDLDLFIGNESISADFGNLPNSYLLINTEGSFSAAVPSPFESLGMVTDAIATDFDNDGKQDLIIVGEWMEPKFFKNENGTFKQISKLKANTLSGLWQSIEPFDIDGDGDEDYLLGNWGTNSKFSASEANPMKMFYSDFDSNGATETIVCTYKDNAYYPLDGLNELSSQLVSLRKSFNSYASFAGKPITEILNKEQLKNAQVRTVNTLKSGYLKNENGSFSFVPFQSELQLSPLTDFLKFDFDNDGAEEVLIGGNYFGVKPYQGRFDSFPGALLKNEGDTVLGNVLGLNLMFKSVRHLNVIQVKNRPYLLATFNDEPVELYRITEY